MKVTFSKSDFDNTSCRQALVSIIGDAKHGGFMKVNGFKSKKGKGEVQDTTYCKGISYKNAIAKSLNVLTAIQRNNDFEILISRNVWQNDKGESKDTNRKSKEYCHCKTVIRVYTHDDIILTEALEKLQDYLEKQKGTSRKKRLEPFLKKYKKLGNGIYEDEVTKKLYVRDLRLVKKTIVVNGDSHLKASKEINAIIERIKQDMPIGHYRMFNLDGDFDSIKLGGIELISK